MRRGTPKEHLRAGLLCTLLQWLSAMCRSAASGLVSSRSSLAALLTINLEDVPSETNAHSEERFVSLLSRSAVRSLLSRLASDGETVDFVPQASEGDMRSGMRALATSG